MFLVSISFAQVKKYFMWFPFLNGVSKYDLDYFFGRYVSNNGEFSGGYYIYKENIVFGAIFKGDQLIKLPTLGGLESGISGGSKDNLLVG